MYIVVVMTDIVYIYLCVCMCMYVVITYSIIMLYSTIILLSFFVLLFLCFYSLRSKTSIRFFPKLFCGYFYFFHIYFFCFPYGFSYLALGTSMLFVLHATMHLMNNYEIPAYEYGEVTALNPRAGLVDYNALEREGEDAAEAAESVQPGGNGAVFRRMQALRRAMQLAEISGVDTPGRRGSGRHGSRSRGE